MPECEAWFLRIVAAPSSPVNMRRVVRRVFLVLFLLGVLLAIWGFLIEPSRTVIHTVDLQIGNSALIGLRIAALSDIHAGSPHINLNRLEEIVELTNQQNPDLTVLLGDYVIHDIPFGKIILPEVTTEKLSRLKARCGVYAVLGNHDNAAGSKRLRSAFEKNGIPVLDNELVPIRCGGSFYLAGISDVWTTTPKVQATLDTVPADSTVVMITHNPDIFPTVPRRVPLLIAGHTHGGQVYLPFFGRRVVPSEYGQRFAAGHVIEEGHHLFVTTGIGTSIMPFRFLVPPEVALLRIH